MGSNRNISVDKVKAYFFEENRSFINEEKEDDEIHEMRKKFLPLLSPNKNSYY
jgi:hypothetical protein